MRYTRILLLTLGAVIVAPGCGGSSSSGTGSNPAQCADGRDNDNDGLVDFPNDPGCSSASDRSELNAGGVAACADNIDNDGDGRIDFPNDLGCSSSADDDESGPAACADDIDNDGDGQTDFPSDPGCSGPGDNDEADPSVAPACNDGLDNDNDGQIDFPADPGCASAGDNDEADPAIPTACADGLDNDQDGLIDFPADPGCASAADSDEGNTAGFAPRTRYALANQCWALQSTASGTYVGKSDGAYHLNATSLASAERFFLKPSALGKYLLYSRDRALMAATGAGLVGQSSASANDGAEWTVIGMGDTTAYPPTPRYNQEPTPEEVAAFHNFVDPNLQFTEFVLYSAASNTNLTAVGAGVLSNAPAEDSSPTQSFRFEPTLDCAKFPEAQSNFSGTPFRGSTAAGTVLGHADVHVHISATEFLGGAEWGHPYHKFGIEHALGDCSAAHGDFGERDFLGAAYVGDTDGHATDGWPTFSEWPSRDSLTHEAIYWKWLERSWAGGLRVVVNDLVDNETLCELQRNASQDPARDCNSMNNAGRQAGTMYGMQDYIDAQYGGRGAGFFRIVHDAAAARRVIEDGKMAVILGIEISNLFDCKLTYNPLRTERPWDESGSGQPLQNAYDCTVEEGQPNSILTQMQRIHGWGVRQIISIHEFDNAFGGNGIFDGMLLNLGNRENSGGIPSGTISGPFETDPETPTGEFWTTYDCPLEGVTEGFSGYLWGNSGGAVQDFGSPFFELCGGAGSNGVPFFGQQGRAGGTMPCYPADVSQCNARWMTPAGLYTYSKMMEMGFIFDFDHMEMGMKTQALELAEAQDPPYPFVSTHGTFGGTTIDQAVRVLRNGGLLYPSNGSSQGFRQDMEETRGLWEIAMAGRPSEQRFLFGFGYGTDTNGLSRQSRPRNGIGDDGVRPLIYPFTLFAGGLFDQLAEFNTVNGVSFQQPTSTDIDGAIARTWHEDVDGNAHHGMISDFVQEIVLDGTAEEIRHLYNSAEVFLQTWQRTEAAHSAIEERGLRVPIGILRDAPPVGEIVP